MSIIINGTTGISGVDGTAGTPSLQGNDTNTGIVFGTDTVGVSTGGVQRTTVDSSGRLLVGTSTTIAGAVLGTAETRTVQFYNNVNSGNQGLGVYNVSSTPFAARLEVGTAKSSFAALSTDNYLGLISFVGSDGSQFVQGAMITAQADGGVAANDMPTRLTFSVTADGASSPTERMKINNVGVIETFGATSNLSTKSNAGAGTTNFLIAGSHSCTTISTGGTTSFYVWSNGNVQNTNGSYTTISDAKLKENIVNTSSQWNDLKAIQIRNWNFKAETGYGTHRQIGPIAQELEAVCPGLVFETPDRDEDGNETGEVTKGVNQSVLYMKAVKALQEAMERIETLEAKVAALKAQ